ncbi:MAG: hypothetical protein Q8835_03280 [Sweet potato little leaf phytoplasma]|nr:hypothetical protein [Sweet potato little leaf phytoplasma]
MVIKQDFSFWFLVHTTFHTLQVSLFFLIPSSYDLKNQANFLKLKKNSFQKLAFVFEIWLEIQMYH